jgi:hypothetical protein
MLSKSQGSAAADSTPISRWFPHAPFPLVISAGQSSKHFGLTREINVFLNLPTRFSVQVLLVLIAGYRIPSTFPFPIQTFTQTLERRACPRRPNDENDTK